MGLIKHRLEEFHLRYRRSQTPLKYKDWQRLQVKGGSKEAYSPNLYPPIVVRVLARGIPRLPRQNPDEKGGR